MIPADFEESEYRGPLYNQLERGNHLVWEPGQVFEKHIGIDRAAYVTDPYFWGLHGISAPIHGAFLRDYDWNYIWEKKLKNKVLPDFQLNLFLQAKRSHAGTSPRGKVKKAGIVGSYWKFDITPHQQEALERMEKTLNGKAIVSYAAPAFHTQAALFEHTKNQSIVPASSFPPASALAGHGAWYYENGGVSGVANPEFVQVTFEALQTRIVSLIERTQSQGENAEQSLLDLASTLIRLTSEVKNPSPTDTWFQLQLNRVDNQITSMKEQGIEEQYLQPLSHYLQVRAYCNAYHLDWLVLGKGT